MKCTNDRIRELIPDYVSAELDENPAREVQDHMASCPDCQEFADSIGWFSRSLERLASEEDKDHPAEAALVDLVRNPGTLPEDERGSLEVHLSVCTACKSVYRSIKEAQAELEFASDISVSTLISETPAAKGYHLAADSGVEEQTGTKCLATFCSELPEVVLRVMRDSHGGRDYLEVMADDPQALAHAVIHCMQTGDDYVADERGHADIDLATVDDVSTLTWQIKAPQAEFRLDPLEYDPDQVDYAKTTTLTTDRGDRIEIRFEGKTEGKMITVRVLELEGQSDYESLRLALTHKKGSILQVVSPGRTVQLGPVDRNSEIKIHLY